MKLMNYEPNTYLDRFFDDPFFRSWPWRTGWDIDRDSFKSAVKVNIEESDEAYSLTAAVPGMKDEDIDLQIHDGRLTIRGQCESEKETEEKNYHLREFHKESFERSFTLGGNVDPDKVTARMDDGILTVTLPKREEAKPKTVKVEINK